MEDDESKVSVDPRIEGLKARALEQFSLLEKARQTQAVEDSVRLELARARLEIAYNAKSFNRAIDTLLSW